jgi:hypothetical protein
VISKPYLPVSKKDRPHLTWYSLLSLILYVGCQQKSDCIRSDAMIWHLETISVFNSIHFTAFTFNVTETQFLSLILWSQGKNEWMNGWMNEWRILSPSKGKGKVIVTVIPVLFLNRASRHEGALGDWMYSATHSLTLTLHGGEWSASRPGRFTPKERIPYPYCIRGLWR